MKKYIGLFVAVLLLGSVTYSYSHSILADPKTTDGAAYQVTPIYNNSGAALDAGDVVVWDIGNSTGDNDLYVTTTTTADTGIVAGVVLSAIGIASEGSAVVWGFAQCDIGAQGVGDGGPICTSATTGGGDMCSDANGGQAYAIASAAGASGAQIECFVHVR
jgi:hypothetical protein